MVQVVHCDSVPTGVIRGWNGLLFLATGQAVFALSALFSVFAVPEVTRRSGMRSSSVHHTRLGLVSPFGLRGVVQSCAPY